ncbi:MAG: carbamoyl-phosphate synthase large subunit, partial [Oceanococcaceae bacterium]
AALQGVTLEQIDATRWKALKQLGFADKHLAKLLGVKEAEVRKARQSHGVRPVFKRVDTCAAEFPTDTAYLYSTYEEECESKPSDRRKIMVLGGGPNRIGQGIEFDYCCVHAALALREDGYETIMVNCNPETVSTDFDTSDRLYFEPLTLEDVLAIVDVEKPEGVIVQFGGQTPLKLAQALEAAGVPIIGTSPDSIDLAEDRERFQQLVDRLGLLQPHNRIAMSTEQALEMAPQVGFPLVVRPSYVLGGRAMEVVYDLEDLARYMKDAVQASEDSPVLLDRFLEQAIEVDVDAVSDGETVVVAGIMEHIEQAGVHSGDSACSLPPYSLSADMEQRLVKKVTALAKALKVSGLMNTQFAVQGDSVYLLEVNPRAARTVPFVSKAIGAPLAKIAARCMAGQSLADQGFLKAARPEYFSVKESVFPFNKFQGVDPILGPEMKSTGEVMGVGRAFGGAFGKAMLAVGCVLPTGGGLLLSVRDADKPEALRIARHLTNKGFKVHATSGTARYLQENGVACEAVNKVKEGRPHCVDLIKNGEVSLVVNTAAGKKSIAESHSIRAAAIAHKVVYFTTVAGAWATCLAMDHRNDIEVSALRELHQELTA